MLTLDENSAAPILEAAGLSVPSASARARLKRPLKASGNTAEGAPGIRSLTLAIRRGDAAAFARFYDLYSFRLYRFLLVLARGDENTAREVCQAAMTKLAKRFEVFDDERMLWAWLCALALSETLGEALAALRPEERELMQAAYVDGRPLQELADASGLTYKAVESRLARLRQKLKEQLLTDLRHENQS